MISNNEPLRPIFHILYHGSKEGVKGHNIEKYYNDFEHVRIVPARVISDRVDHWHQFSGYSFRKFTESIKFFKQQNTKVTDFKYLGNSSESFGHHYRASIKAQWLINSIQKDGLKEPVTAIVFPADDLEIQKVRMDAVIHPGSFRWYAYDLLDINPDCIVFDAFGVFEDYPKASLTECLDLFKDQTDRFEISILPNNDNYLCPQIMNINSKSYNVNMSDNVGAYESRVRGQWNEDINIFVGYDSRMSDVHIATLNSIIRTSKDIDNTPGINIRLLDYKEIEEYQREWGNQSVEFSYSRFLVPYLSGYKGWSIFVDNDYIFEYDILNLLLYINDEKAVSVVKHDYEEKYDQKFGGSSKDVWYPKKLWSSLMVFNNEHPDCKKLTPEVINNESGQYLHQFEWTAEETIGEIPKRWVWTEGYDSVETFKDSWAKHWTRGGYWIDGMDCSDIYGLNLHSAYMKMTDPSPVRFRSYLDPRKYFEMDYIANKDNSVFCRQKQLGE